MKNNTFRKIIALALVWCLTMGGVPAVALSDGTDAADAASASCTHPNINSVAWQDYDAEQHARQCPDCGTLLLESHAEPTDWSPYDTTQHRRECPVCHGYWAMEYEDHYGGTATCSEQAVCEACGMGYGEFSTTNHTGFNNWKWNDDTVHSRLCEDCYEMEYANHTGGDDSCRPTCDVCGELYYNANGKHTGGEATCWMPAVCEACGTRYGEKSTTHGEFSEWYSANATQHFRYCTECGEEEYADHTGGTATCADQAECEVCGVPYGEYSTTTHGEFTDWFAYDNTQHYRRCIGCGEMEYADHTGGDDSCMPTCDVCGEQYYNANGKHTGGTATCWQRAKCEVCNQSYGELSTTNHGEFSDWAWDTDTQHYRYCTKCWEKEYADHTGGDDSCMPTCSVCNTQYFNANGNHGEFSDWYNATSTQHLRYCMECWDVEYADHTGGTATCSTLAVCEECGEAYGELSTTNHGEFSDWHPHDDTQHSRFCVDCGKNAEYANHTGGTATCISPAVCEVCDRPYGGYSTTNHYGFSDWYNATSTQHYRYCAGCGLEEEYADHTGGDGSCMPICADCGTQYYDISKHTGGTATCATLAVCEVCNRPYGELSTTHGEFSEWYSAGATQHFRFCTVCGENEEYANHTGGTATCMQLAVCEVCDMEYGEYSTTNHGEFTDWSHYGITQHVRFCTDCGDEEVGTHTNSDGLCMPTCDVCGGGMGYNANGKHTGGTATCSMRALCEMCNAEYGELSTTHGEFSEWFFYNHTQHYRYCMECGQNKEYGTHTGGTATCTQRAKCEVCNRSYGELSTTHGEFTDWEGYDDTQHYRYCTDCGENEEYADHTGGTATCSQRAVCEACGQLYGELSTNHGEFTNWIGYDETQHFRYCTLCGVEEYADHTGGTATCSVPAECEACGQLYGELSTTNHGEFSDWRAYYETQHVRYCTLCGDEEYADHTGGTATCMERAVCEACDKAYGELSTTNHGEFSDWIGYDVTQHYRWCTDCGWNWEYGTHTGGTATCMELAVCKDCDETYGDYSTTNHGEFSDWTWYTDTQHYRYCKDCGENEEYANHTGGTATCESRPVCEVCKSEYGSSLGGHAWGEWTTNGDGTHTRECFNDSTHTETGTCSGGKANCDWGAVCDLCGAAYTEPTSTHTGPFSEWTCVGGTGTHSRYCKTCLDEEFGDCTGGTATCVSGPVCTICEGEYGNRDTTAHVGPISEWMSNGAAEHMRTCSACGYYEFEKHSPGTAATCMTGAICAVCNAEYGQVDYNNHIGLPTEWEHNSGRHWKYCQTCQGYVFGYHTGGEATCTEDGVCEVCDAAYIPATGHKWGKGESNDDGTHTRVCANDATHTETDDCSGGKATCTEDGVCEVCDAAYIPAIKHNYGEWESNGDGTHTRVCLNDATHTETEDCSGGTATCTEDGVCEVCDAAYIPAIKHNYGEWESNGDGTHTRVCLNDATHTETEDCSGGKATCTAKAVCEVCSSEHGAALGHIPGAEADCINDQLCTREGCGAVLAEKLGHIPGAEADCTNDQLCTREGCGAVLAEKLGHDYAAVLIKPTCTKQGYTTYTCSRCEDSYKADQTAARGHWYDLWYPNQDGTHSAECKRYGCSHEGTAECTLYEVTVKDGDTETILTVCPVCGDHERAIFGVVSGATIKTVYINQRLLRGEQIVRELDAPFDGVLYAFTAAYESAGYVEPFNGKVSVSLPLDAEKYAEFKLVRVDVTPATETTERTEVWTEVAFTFEDGRLTFETYVDGLFLLIPVE